MTKSSRNGLIAGVVGFVILVAFAFVADQFVRAQEYRTFLHQVEAAEDSMESFNLREDRLWANRPGSQRAWEQRWRNYGSAAYDNGTNLAVVYVDMERTSVLPWHWALKTARADYLEHVGAWRDDMQSVYEFGRNPQGDPPVGNKLEISSTWVIAQKSSENALPWLFSGELRERQADLFDD